MFHHLRHVSRHAVAIDFQQTGSIEHDGGTGRPLVRMMLFGKVSKLSAMVARLKRATTPVWLSVIEDDKCGSRTNL